MANRETIITMAKLASYDKYYAGGDRKKAEFFRHDYIYRQNLTSRFFTLFGSMIVVAFYFMHRLTIDKLDILNISEVMLDVIKVIIFIIVVQLLYSLLGFLIYSRDYNSAQKRIAEYMENMNELARLKSAAPFDYNDEQPRVKGTDIRKHGASRKERRYDYYEPDHDEYFKD